MLIKVTRLIRDIFRNLSMRGTHFQNLKLFRTVFVKEGNRHTHHTALILHIRLIYPLSVEERGSILFGVSSREDFSMVIIQPDNILTAPHPCCQ